jgi:hypothetical protein
MGNFVEFMLQKKGPYIKKRKYPSNGNRFFNKIVVGGGMITYFDAGYLSLK